MTEKLVIFGVGETAHLAYEYFTHDSNYDISAFAVDPEYMKEKIFCGLPVLSLSEVNDKYPPAFHKGFVAVSSGKLNRDRKSMVFKIKNLGYELISYVSSRAFVWPNVEIGENCFILEGNTLQPFTKIGNNVVLWSGNHIGHRSIIHDNCFISSHCVISGFCEIGESSFLGVNCTIEDGVKIGVDNFIGAGAIIRKNTNPDDFYQEDQAKKSVVNTHRLFKIKEN
ncbi:acetyltransferase [Castellaniella sp.]|uniref:acetyltransferase n=1 Tax=Castellaniella sp. TaxID=1955812 RepID=UPI002AFF08A4|nr:acetyltransferase [Castellaniella sp.]